MTKDSRIDQLIEEIKPLQAKLVDHPVYAEVKSISDLQLFMSQHIYAVWDFMSLLKYLQLKLTCVKIPWVPVGNPKTRYLINEIVTDEECDENEEGLRMSHFELYLTAMKRAEAPTEEIERFIDLVANQGVEPRAALAQAGTSKPVTKFVTSTFDVIDLDKPHVAAAVFTFGREDLIPGMFISFVRELHKDAPEKYSIFKYYLERHIEVDGDHHAHLAHEMTALLCGNDDKKWEEARAAVKDALQQRIDLWDGIREQIVSKGVNDLKV
uniref:ARAD1A09504p n=1 Tax=Blastobotrys adeninivorans TaxID=409370 RepID=A0A060SXH5_BLAAD